MKSFSLKKLIYVLLIITSQAHGFDIKGGEVVGRHIHGLATDYQGDPVLVEDRPLIYDKSNFDELISVDEKDFLISGFNHQIGGVYVTQVDSKENKTLDTSALDLASIGGLSYPTAGIKTDWNSILLSESHLINAREPESFIKAYQPYFKEKSSLVKPYNYGWISEVILLDAKGQAKAIKNYALGRLFATEVMMMPDGKTFYMLDSQHSGNLYLFIAEQKNSLAKGTLYAVSRQNNKVSYAQLGKVSALKAKFKLKKLTFDSIFETANPANHSCPVTFKYIESIYGEECLKIKSKNKKYAGLFEPIRMMAMMGTARFSSEISTMKFDADKKQVMFERDGQTEMTFSVGQDTKFDSQYILQESR